jgi:uncharacterized protein
MSNYDRSHFLGRGWAFPTRFEAGTVVMSSDEQDISESLYILFGTRPGDRFLQPRFGLDMSELLFEPLSTTLRNLLEDRIRVALLVFEARIQVHGLVVDDSRAFEGVLQIRLTYSVRSTNARFNLVYPYYLGDANEVRAQVAAG